MALHLMVFICLNSYTCLYLRPPASSVEKMAPAQNMLAMTPALIGFWLHWFTTNLRPTALKQLLSKLPRRHKHQQCSQELDPKELNLSLRGEIHVLNLV